MHRPLRLHPEGLARYHQWQDAPETDPEDVALVQDVLIAIAADGWPPTVEVNKQLVPRWMIFEDPHEPGQWIVARNHRLWVVVVPPEADEDTFDFVHVHYATDDELASEPWTDT